MEYIKTENSDYDGQLNGIDYQRVFGHVALQVQEERVDDDDDDKDDVIKFVATSMSRPIEAINVAAEEVRKIPIDDIIETIKQHLQEDHQNQSFASTSAATWSSPQANSSSVSIQPSIALGISGVKRIISDTAYNPKTENCQLSVKKPNGSEILNAYHVPSSGNIRCRYNVVVVKCLLDNCQLYFKKREHVVAHMATAHQRFNLQYRCMYQGCGMTFKDDASFNDHSQGHKDPYKCAKCAFVEANYKDMNRHMFYYHELGTFNCILSNCSYTATTRIEAVTHYHTEHRPFKCDWPGCKRTFSFMHQKQNHHKKHTARRRYQCYFDNCDKSFIVHNDFANHIRTHTGVKPYRCRYPKCDYFAKTHSSVIRHIRLRHFNKNVRDKNLVDPTKYCETLRELL